MRLFPVSFTALTLAAALLTGCNLHKSNSQAQQVPPKVTATPYPDGARRVTIRRV